MIFGVEIFCFFFTSKHRTFAPSSKSSIHPIKLIMTSNSNNPTPKNLRRYIPTVLAVGAVSFVGLFAAGLWHIGGGVLLIAAGILFYLERQN